VVRLPVVPLALDPVALQANPANSIIPAIDRDPLVVRENALIILEQ